MTDLDRLWEYQQARQRLVTFERQILSAPDHQRLGKLHRFLSQQQATISELQEQIEAKVAEFDKFRVMAAGFEHDLTQETSEFQSLKDDEQCTAAEMAEFRHRIDKLNESVESCRRSLYDTIAWIEKASTTLEETYLKAKKANKEYKTLHQKCEEDIKSHQSELDALKAEAAEKEKPIPADVLEKYKAICKRYQMPMAKLENDRCGECSMSLPASVAHSVAMGNRIIECENCGRILYAPENAD
ncbi:MAG: zinc ribbon domain-containing protein [Christensenellales bacterium]